MGQWAAVVDAEQYDTERLYAHDCLVVPAAGLSPAIGDPVLLLTGDPTVLFGLGRVAAGDAPPDSVTVAYTHRLFDDPRPVPLNPSTGLTAVTSEQYDAAVRTFGADRRVDADRSEWFVSVTLPIEAGSRAEAVREFWTYIDSLGPRELPAFVWPRGDELAMQAYVLGTASNQDPEGDD